MAMFGGAFKSDGKTWGVAEWVPGVFFLVTVSMKDGSLFPVVELSRAEALNEPIKRKPTSWAEV